MKPRWPLQRVTMKKTPKWLPLQDHQVLWTFSFSNGPSRNNSGIYNWKFSLLPLPLRRFQYLWVEFMSTLVSAVAYYRAYGHFSKWTVARFHIHHEDLERTKFSCQVISCHFTEGFQIMQNIVNNTVNGCVIRTPLLKFASTRTFSDLRHQHDSF